jgi:hypothetical protein
MHSLSTKIFPKTKGVAPYNEAGVVGEEEGNLNRTPFGVTLALKYSLISCHVTELQIRIGKIILNI